MRALVCLLTGCCLSLLPALPAQAAAPPAGFTGCRLPGLETGAWCSTVQRPLDPEAPGGRQIDIHFAVLPAVARNKKPDPILFFAGGPGQSAIDLAGTINSLLARFGNRRDIVLIDQRGTGRSAPLDCDDDPPTRPLRDSFDNRAQLAELHDCRQRLMALPYGDLRQFTTTIAMQDADAVRRKLGVRQFDVIGGSYGTRAALEYMRQFPRAVRRLVLDGVAPPDMVLPLSFSTDVQAAFDALLSFCEADATCRARYPQLRRQWQELLAGLPRDAVVQHPVTGVDERLTITRDVVMALVRPPLYAPLLSSALPLAIGEAAQGRFTPLVGLGAALAGGSGPALAQGMHFSVVCAEDAPLMATATDRPGADFGDSFADLYRRVCADWPRGAVPAAFYRVPPAPSATLVLSGAIDPVTPPRHGERVARALGAKARHVVVPNAGHGVLALPCMRDVVYRFIDAPDDDEALRVDTTCAARLPRPGVFVPVTAGVAR